MRTRTFPLTITPLLRSLLALGAVTAFAACSDSTSPNAQVAGGNYALASVNGSNVPYTYTVGSTTITINSDIYTLQSNGTYTEQIDETVSNGVTSSPASDAEEGNWTQNGTAVIFDPTQSTQGNTSEYTGSLTGGSTFSHSSLTFSYNGVVWIYNHT